MMNPIIKNKYQSLIIFFLIIIFNISKKYACATVINDSIIFKIQIAALPYGDRADILQKISGINAPMEIEYHAQTNMFKYLVKSFNTFEQANNYLENLNQHYGAFIVMYVNHVRKNRDYLKAYLHTLGIEIDSNQVIIHRAVLHKNTLKMQEGNSRIIHSGTILISNKKGNRIGKMFSNMNIKIPGLLKKPIREISESFSKNSFFFNRINLLLFMITLSFMIIMFLILFIFLIRFKQIKNTKKYKQYEEKIQNDLIQYLFRYEPNENIPNSLILSQNKREQIILFNEIINLYSNIMGSTADRLRDLFYKSGLDHFLIKKLTPDFSYSAIRNMNVLARMNVYSAKELISRFINSSNQTIRQEAHVAMVLLDKNKPLSFLDNTAFPLNHWEQIKLHDIFIRTSNIIPEFSELLSSENESVLIFSLRMMHCFNQISGYEHVIKLLNHPNNQIRYHAILVASEFKKEETIEQLIKNWHNESIKNKIAILHGINLLQNPIHIGFLKSVLSDLNPEIRLKATESIADIGSQGIQELNKILNDTEDKQLIEIINYTLKSNNE